MIKLSSFLLLCLFCAGAMIAQVSPVTTLSLHKGPSQTPPDSLGTTWFYSVKFEAADSLVLTSAVFHLKSTATRATINQQTFILPTNDGTYQNGAFPNGITKDHNTFFILLGNVKSFDPLTLVADFIDTKNRHYNTILMTE